MQDKKGYVSFVLHAHLPFIHHPESDDYLEETWLFEDKPSKLTLSWPSVSVLTCLALG